VWATGLISALVAAGLISALEGLGLAGAADAQGFELAWRVLCTPVSSMLTAP
jgi:hypothetical protein